MPNVPVKTEEVKSAINKLPGTAIIGVCFMHMFDMAGWISTVSFDCMIDAMIDPTEVTTKK